MEFNNGYGNQQNQIKPVTVYSSYRFNNAESTIDPTCLTFSYWKNCLKVGISPKKNTPNENGFVTFDTENGIYVFLTYLKARILSGELKKFLENPNEYNNRGIPSGQGLITISNGQEFNIDNPVLTIRKINEVGITTSAFAYEFKKDYYYAINNYGNDGSFVKTTDDYRYMEVQMVIDLLDSYVEAMTYSVSYTVYDKLNYPLYKMNEKLDALMQSAGVKVNNNNNNRYNSSSIFNSAGTGMNTGSGGSEDNLPFDSSSMDDIM